MFRFKPSSLKIKKLNFRHIKLPTKKLKVTTRKTPCGQGTHTYDKWEMRIHRRILDIAADDRTMKQLMHINIPEEVIIEVALHK